MFFFASTGEGSFPPQIPPLLRLLRAFPFITEEANISSQRPPSAPSGLFIVRERLFAELGTPPLRSGVLLSPILYSSAAGFLLCPRKQRLLLLSEIGFSTQNPSTRFFSRLPKSPPLLPPPPPPNLFLRDEAPGYRAALPKGVFSLDSIFREPVFLPYPPGFFFVASFFSQLPRLATPRNFPILYSPLQDGNSMKTPSFRSRLRILTTF